ncbi:SUMF1/EgtB/PvdO family nonheme iron enzyme [Roseivirga echinicomitans]
MKVVLPLLFFLFGLNSSSDSNCVKCDQDRKYYCASNTLAMNFRLCMDITEVSGRMYKIFLLDQLKAHGATSTEFTSNLPNWKLWEELYTQKTASEISELFFETSTFALAPMVGVSYEQAVNFAAWRTEAFRKELDKMDKRDRENFPKEFEFRLPTPAEWSRMRFMTQEKEMLKEVGKIAVTYEKEFKVDRNKLLNSSKKVHYIFANMDKKLGLFGLHDNVAEMTSEKGVAMGGSWNSKSAQADFTKKSEYTAPQAWLGFRCIFEIIE